MKKSINEELNSIKFLFKYKAGKVLSEQPTDDVNYEDMDDGSEMTTSFDPNMEVDDDLIENRELEVPVKPGTKTPTKPDKDSPYKPKPGPKKAPKAKMPEWLSFDAIGININ
jgi:hypothetical protein